MKTYQKLLIGMTLIASTSVFSKVLESYSGSNANGELCTLDITSSPNENGVKHKSL